MKSPLKAETMNIKKNTKNIGPPFRESNEIVKSNITLTNVLNSKATLNNYGELSTMLLKRQITRQTSLIA